MGNPSGEPPNPEEADRRRRERDTEPIPRGRPDEQASSSDSGDDQPRVTETQQVRQTIVDYGGPPVFSKEELAGLDVDAAGFPITSRRIMPLEDEPSAIVARYLFPSERYRGEWRRHWIYVAGPVAIGIVATFILGYLSGFLAGHAAQALTTVAVILWLIVLGWVAYKIVDWHFDRFLLTNRRVMLVRGIVTRNVAMMPLQRVTDMKYEQSPVGRALNYGTFVLESAGQEQALRTIKHLPNPNEIYLRVVEEMYEPQAVEARLSKEDEEFKKQDKEEEEAIKKFYEEGA